MTSKDLRQEIKTRLLYCLTYSTEENIFKMTDEELNIAADSILTLLEEICPAEPWKDPNYRRTVC